MKLTYCIRRAWTHIRGILTPHTVYHAVVVMEPQKNINLVKLAYRNKETIYFHKVLSYFLSQAFPEVLSFIFSYHGSDLVLLLES
jgi:hypothetical protein